MLLNSLQKTVSYTPLPAKNRANATKNGGKTETMNKSDDKTNRAILRALKTDARASWRQVGRAVHLSGQAVAERVRQMQDDGVISGFTLRQDRLPRHFVSVMMGHNRFDEFEQLLLADERVESADKTHGGACYHIVYIAENAEILDQFLNRILPHGTYHTLSSLRRVK